MTLSLSLLGSSLLILLGSPPGLVTAGPTCGNGILEPGEACDDGNDDNSDACLADCRPATCGDGFVWRGYESCDDGNTDDTDACVSTCQNAACGDGFTQAGVEGCDDGNANDTDDCLASCLLPSCGDRVVRAGIEQCDDGNQNDTDDCVQGCKQAGCGDGFVQAGVEECDDGNNDNSDGCLADCRAAACGDGFVWQGHESCDDGNTSDKDTCLSSCVAAAPRDDVLLRITAFDAAGLASPLGLTMRQSAELAANSYELGFWGLRAARRALLPGVHPWLGTALEYGVGLGFVALVPNLPAPFSTWMHEEYHLDALGAAGVSGRNGAWRWPGPLSGTVYDVSDPELIALKAKDPAGFVRSETAGIEAQDDLVWTGVTADFFSRDKVALGPLYLWNALYTSRYLSFCGPESDLIKEFTLEFQPTDPLERDFVGLDCTAWVYDLHRPNEPYEARGPHPSGEGLIRPIGFSDLTAEEQRFLTRQQRLSLIDFANPFAYGLHHLQAGSLQLNALAQHIPAPFGAAVHFTALVKGPQAGWYASYWHQFNLERVFPGVELARVDQPVSLLGRELRLSPRLAFWLQPEELAGAGASLTPGGLVGLRVETPLRSGLDLVVEAQGKTAGWVRGEADLGPAATLRLGLQWDPVRP